MSTAVKQQDFTEEQRSVLKKGEKLLRLAGGVANAEEAASAAAKAQDLLLAYNLDAAAVGSADDGARMQEKLRGGHYEYERNLWSWVAEVNFCLCWTQTTWVDRPENQKNHVRVQNYRDSWARDHIRVRQQRLIGRRVNVETVKWTMSYLLDAIERLTREYMAPGLTRTDEGRVVGLAQALRSSRAVSFREGVAHSVISRLQDRREVQLRTER